MFESINCLLCFTGGMVFGLLLGLIAHIRCVDKSSGYQPDTPLLDSNPPGDE